MWLIIKEEGKFGIVGVVRGCVSVVGDSVVFPSNKIVTGYIEVVPMVQCLQAEEVVWG